MPVTNRGAQVIFHALAEDDAVLIVVSEGERVVALGAFVADRLDAAEKRSGLLHGGCTGHDLVSSVTRADVLVELGEQRALGRELLDVTTVRFDYCADGRRFTNIRGRFASFSDPSEAGSTVSRPDLRTFSVGQRLF